MIEKDYCVNWNLYTHIIGKVYCLTQENMNAMIYDIESLKSESARYREALENISTLGNMFDEKASAQVAREALKGGK